jgi:GDPmannose 4,6-dehydratase
VRTALVTGVSGQDGSHLAELLLGRGYRVVGTTRDAARALPAGLGERVELVAVDMLDGRRMAEVLARHRPDEVYNLAACTSGEGQFDDAVEIGRVNGLAVSVLLEAIRQVDPRIRFCQASSSEMFGDTTESPQSEETPFHPRSFYGAAKLYAHWMVRAFRRRHGLFAASAILFNHEGPRRGPGFVTRKVTSQVARIAMGLATELRLGNLDARRDWGYAGDHVRGMWLMLQQEAADDFVLATGETHSVRELCQQAFGHVGLDYRDHVREDAAAFRPPDPVQPVGNPAKARARLGWSAEVRFGELVDMMVDADLRLLREGAGGA